MSGLFDAPGDDSTPYRSEMAVGPADPDLIVADGVVIGVVVDHDSPIGTALAFQFFAGGEKAGPQITLTGWHGTLITLLADAQLAQAEAYEGRLGEAT